jgi:oxaloacetate decarboxylase beta subunit
MQELSQFIQTTGFLNVTWGNLVMIISGMIFIYLGVAKEFEPLLLIPIGFGIIVGNMPGVSQQGLGVMNEALFLNYLYLE